MGIGAFLLDERLGVVRAIRFVEDWHAAVADHPKIALVSYEELCGDLHCAFGRIARVLDPGTTDAEIAAAVRFGDFAAMRAREEQGFFSSERLRPCGSAPEGRKVRRGKIGGYRDYLSPADLAAVDRLVAPAAADGDAERRVAYR